MGSATKHHRSASLLFSKQVRGWAITLSRMRAGASKTRGFGAASAVRLHGKVG
jgi:hypothetical protein